MPITSSGKVDKVKEARSKFKTDHSAATTIAALKNTVIYLARRVQELEKQVFNEDHAVE